MFSPWNRTLSMTSLIHVISYKGSESCGSKKTLEATGQPVARAPRTHKEEETPAQYSAILESPLPGVPQTETCFYSEGILRVPPAGSGY